MIRRGTLIVIALLIILLGATWFLEWSPSGKTRAHGTPTATPYPSLFAWNVDQLDTIEISVEGNNPVSLRRNPDNTWGFSSPQGILADQGKVLQFITSLQSMEIQTIMDPTAALDMLGLVQSVRSIKLQINDGSSVTFKIGQTTPTNTGYYCQVNNDIPVVLSKGAVDSMLELATVDALVLPTPTVILETPVLETPTPGP
jgi:hypothetical protein